VNILTNEELKRGGVGAIEDALREGPVHLVKGKRTVAVAVSQEEYARLVAGEARSIADAHRPAHLKSA
jgi:hypothetical protein